MKMNNLNALLNKCKDLELVGFTTVWNYHNADHLDNLAKKKGTNISKSINELKEKGMKGWFTLFVTQIGWTAHSASKVAILKGITNIDETSYYYTKRIGEVFIE